MLTGTLILFSVLFCVIMIHEFGHLVMAKKFGIKVHTFSAGFGQGL